ncbi:protein DPCD [Ischnura elegans]|uniref:protein DPCD n=1 Tax=Ischnura elegans TaxID=197161 RepID=UPI001ED89D57|nr:protein DPCD [Ischnura elegans]
MSDSAENNWLNIVRKAEKSCIIENGMRKVHYKFPRGEEMVEEYNMETDVINRRLWKNVNKFGGEETWEAEIGEPEKTSKGFDVTGIKESSSNPFIVRRSTKNILEWRIRNLTYPLSTYSVTACPEQKSIVVRTSNKKFFKVLKIPELERLGLLPEQNMIDYTHKFNTLIISYQKPPQLIALEAEVMKELKKIKTTEKGNLPCNPS